MGYGGYTIEDRQHMRRAICTHTCFMGRGGGSGRGGGYGGFLWALDLNRSTLHKL